MTAEFGVVIISEKISFVVFALFCLNFDFLAVDLAQNRCSVINIHWTKFVFTSQIKL